MRRSSIALLALTASLLAVPALCNSIRIPGFESIHLKAGQLLQAVSFHNSQENPCYFRLTLITEDGRELWHSELIEPGEVVQEIMLNEALEVGTYGAILKYSYLKRSLAELQDEYDIAIIDCPPNFALQ